MNRPFSYSENNQDVMVFCYTLSNFRICTILIEPLTPFDRTSRIKMYENNARSSLFCRIAKRPVVKWMPGHFSAPVKILMQRVSQGLFMRSDGLALLCRTTVTCVYRLATIGPSSIDLGRRLKQLGNYLSFVNEGIASFLF